MKRVNDYIRDRLTACLVDETGDKKESLASLRQSEWSSEFERHMRNRLIMGRFRYGRMDREEDTNYDRVASIRARIALYETTGNLEFMVDVANMCMLEFEHSTHPTKHFHAADDGIHAEKI